MTAKNSIIPVFVPHLGCPNHCVFCNQHRISGSTRTATAEDVVNSIQKAAALTPCGTKRQLAFYGGSFTAIPTAEQIALLEAAQPFLKDGTISSIRLSTRPDAIDEEILQRLRQYGVTTVELGAQSLDDRVLYLSGRGHTAREVEEAAKMVKSHGFSLVLQMMTGLPGDSGESSIQTAKRIVELRPDAVRIYPTVIVRDTELYEMWRAGEYTEHSVESAVELCAELAELFDEAHIPIIRLGLNPTEDLSHGDAVGGAYHPALGEMVRSRMMLHRAQELLRGIPTGSSVVLGVHPAEISKMTGQHRCNVEALTKEFSLKSLKIRACEIEKGKIIVTSLD